MRSQRRVGGRFPPTPAPKDPGSMHTCRVPGGAGPGPGVGCSGFTMLLFGWRQVLPVAREPRRGVITRSKETQ